VGHYVIATTGNPDFGKYYDFEIALEAALLQAAAAKEAIERTTWVKLGEIVAYVEGDPRPESNNWRAGACPEKDNGKYWPRVEWRK
jgi:hypothetical protein